MKDAVKMMWWGVLFNAAVAVMNTGFLMSKVAAGNWWGAAFTLFLVVLNCWSSWFVYGRLQKYKADEKQRVVDILSGKFG